MVKVRFVSTYFETLIWCMTFTTMARTKVEKFARYCLSVAIIGSIMLGAQYFAGDIPHVLNPNGFLRIVYPTVGFVSAFAFLALVWVLKRLPGNKDDVWVFAILLLPCSTAFAYALVIGALPIASLAISSRQSAIEVVVSASGSALNSRACSTSRLNRPVVHFVRIEGQPPYLHQICLPSVRVHTSSGQTALAPPTMPDPGPALIIGQGNWFAVRVESFGGLEEATADLR